MFTGIIEGICNVKSIGHRLGGLLLTVDLSQLAEGCKVGDSIAINGACLTITELIGSLASFALSAETITKSTLGTLRQGRPVNVERALKAADRFGGHFVLGHVDGKATIKAIKKGQGEFADMTFATEPELIDQMVVKGSVAVDGISLTIVDIDDESFSISLIPETLKKTTLGNARTSDIVNVETDIIVKAIKRHLDDIMPTEQPLTVERLRQSGF